MSRRIPDLLVDSGFIAWCIAGALILLVATGAAALVVDR